MSAVPVRPAATVLLLRDTEHGPEVFMLRRTTDAAFASGMYVFPGGRVDDGDASDGVDPFAVAAIREAFEEAGVLLAHNTDGEAVGGDHPVFAQRLAVHGGHRSFAELCAEHGLRLAIAELHWLSRWVTPAGGEGKRRFDTHFFVARAPSGHVYLHDEHETVDSVWIRPAAALARHNADDLAMMPPTVGSLQFVAGYRTVADVLSALAARLPRSYGEA